MDTPVPQELIDDIIDCGRHAPSGCNAQPWSFIVVRDAEKRKALSKIQNYASFVEQAPVCIVACMTLEEIRFKPSNYLSVACAVENMLLRIHDLGLLVVGHTSKILKIQNQRIKSKSYSIFLRM